MTIERSISIVRDILRDGRLLDAIRFLRSLGMSFWVARRYVDEVRADAPWWRQCR